MTNRENILEILAKIMQTSVDSIDLSTKISDIDINSLDVVEMVMKIEDQFNVDLSIPEDVSYAKTVGDLVDALEQMIKEAKDG